MAAKKKVVPPFRRMPEALRRVLNAELEGVPRAELPRFVHVHPEEVPCILGEYCIAQGRFHLDKADMKARDALRT